MGIPDTPTGWAAVEAVTATVAMAEYLPACVDLPRVAGYCAACPNYGARWTCPPHSFDPMGLWRRYGAITLHGRVFCPPAAMGEAEALAALEAEKAALLDALLALEAATPGALALAAGTCTRCDEAGGPGCARPAGHPCRHPEAMRYSIEALGGDVALTARRWLGRPLLWISGGVVPPYLTLVGGLLLPG